MTEDTGARRRRRPPGHREAPPVIDRPAGSTTVEDPKPDGKGGSLDLSGWQVDLPILLLPVRLETRYLAGSEHDELRIRIWPDPVSVQGAAAASERELEEGRDFWLRYSAVKKPAVRSAAWRQFARRLGSVRAGYVARLTRPVVGADGRLIFPEVDLEAPAPGVATLLPQRWIATGWVGDEIAFERMSRPVIRPLVVSPDPTAAPDTIQGSRLRIDPGTAWMFDYELALERGMAITVPLVGRADMAAQGLSVLTVVGLDPPQQPPTVVERLTALFEQHSRSTGLAFVPQGTPTNNTASVRSGYRRVETEFADLEARELGAYMPHPDDNATRLAGALGLATPELFWRLAHGADREFEASRDMRIALFETVLGTYLRELLATHDVDGTTLSAVFDDGTIDDVRDWFVTWVTGGAPVPTVRIGDQPYGILPVLPSSPAGTSDVPGLPTTIAGIVEILLEEWRLAVAAVPVLDHNATDSLSTDPDLADAEARDLVTRVLANNPHPRRLAVRTATDWSDQPRPEEPSPTPTPSTGRAAARNTAARSVSSVDVGTDTWSHPLVLEPTGGFRWEYSDALDRLNGGFARTLKPLYDAVLQAVVPPRAVFETPTTTVPGAATPRPEARESVDRPSTESDIRGIEQQIEVWTLTDAAIDEPGAVFAEFADIEEVLHSFTADVLTQLERHELRQRPLRWLDLPGLDGVLGRDELQLLLTRLSTIERLWRRATVADDPPPAGIDAAAYLSDLSRRAGGTAAAAPGPVDSSRQVSGPIGKNPLETDVLPHRPPLLDTLPPEFTATAPLLYQLIDATLPRSEPGPELGNALARLAALEPDELDWLLRETIGLGTHRLDAWHTGLASERLGALREKAAAGLYVGSYGFVLDLERSDDRPSHGFLHAPSLPHAATAAVLRSGWLARGAGDDSAPAAVDLASSRLRQADWVLSGVRHGQDLGELLGAAFERSLHDANLDVAIRPIRQTVADADHLGESATNLPVDGIRVLDLHRDGGPLADTLAELELPPARRTKLDELIAALADVFDAVDDATTFEMVHQLVTGNLERAAAVVDGMGPNGGAVPELLGVQTPRGALTVDIRTLVLIDADAQTPGKGWTGGTRGAFDPALDSWVAAVLPPADDVGWTATTAAGESVQLRLSSLALSALDACYLAGDDPTATTPGLRRLAELATAGRRIARHHPADGGTAPVSLAEFQLLATELRRLLQEANPAAQSTVSSPGEAPPEVDTGSVVARADTALASIVAAFDAVSSAEGWTGLTVEHATVLARIGLVPSETADPAADFAAMRARIGRRTEVAREAGGTGTIENARARVAAITGAAVPLLATFHLPVIGGVQFSPALADEAEVDDWFELVAPVHPRAEQLWRALRLSGMLGQAPPRLVAGQSPLLDGDRWAALYLPAPGSGGRVAAAAVSHGAVAAGSNVVGLLIDQWSERIPGTDQVTGVAFHFDAPSTEAPQTMLLAVPPAGSGWSVELVQNAVLETIEWMQLRAVGIDDLGDYGHALPTTFVPGTVDGSTVAGTS